MNPSFDPRPLSLEGRHVRLEPLAPAHAPGLFDSGADAETWTYLLRPALRSLDDTSGWVRECLALAADGGEVPFVVVHRESDRCAGSTSYLDIRRPP